MWGDVKRIHISGWYCEEMDSMGKYRWDCDVYRRECAFAPKVFALCFFLLFYLFYFFSILNFTDIKDCLNYSYLFFYKTILIL